MEKSLIYSSSAEGPWVNKTNRYLGLKFVINGQDHYGWARLSTTHSLTGSLTGYAYETVPNKQILEGATSDTAAVDLPDPPTQYPASSGMLARGVDALAIWRRDYTPVAYKRSDEIA
jgi:hypothetical protein